MGMFLNEVLTKSNNLNKEEYLNLVNSLLGNDNPDYDFDDLPSIDGYEVLPVYDEMVNCFEIAKAISKQLNALTISFYVFDSDVAYFKLFDKETVIDVLINKETAALDGIEEEDNNVELIVNYIDNKYSIDDVYKIINKDYTFAEDGLAELLKLFNIDLNSIVY